MTIKQLVNMTVEQLEAMSQEELDKWCAPYRTITTTATVEVKEGDNIVDLDMQQEKKERRVSSKKQTKDDMLKMMHQLAQLHGVSLDQKLPTGLK